MIPRAKTIVAIPTGDPSGIGPEVSVKAALDPSVRAACNPIVVSDPMVVVRHARACGIAADLNVVAAIADADWSGARLNVLACEQPGAAKLNFGVSNAAGGRASLAFASAAIKAALMGSVDAVVAAPQNETSISLAGIAFNGYPSFVARETGTDEDDVYLMLCFGDTKIVHATLHQSIRDAIASITREKVGRVIDSADHALKQLGIPKPNIVVGGLNPHAGEGWLSCREEIEIIKPAIEMAATKGIHVTGPFGVGAMFEMQSVDAFIVMLHDQGHIAAKLLAPNAIAAVTIGTPILFSSVAHGSAYDVAGKGTANPRAMIESVLQLAKATPRAR